MLDYRHGLTGNRISSFNPAYQIVQTNFDGTGDIEFDFWSARKTCYYDTFNNLDGSEIEFQVQGCDDEKRFGESPSPLWGANKVTDVSPLLHDSHFYNNLSPSSRKKAIEDGRKQMMEMIGNMPESSYELSLKDMVDDQHVVEVVKEKAVSDHKSLLLETDQSQIKKKQRKGCPISRSGSMDADNFLIKMFFPSSLSFKKKSTGENSSKVSPSPSSEGSEKKPVDKRWWIKRIFMGRDHKNREDSSIDSNNSSRSRYFHFFYRIECTDISKTITFHNQNFFLLVVL